jgi:hypothetical protein
MLPLAFGSNRSKNKSRLVFSLWSRCTKVDDLFKLVYWCIVGPFNLGVLWTYTALGAYIYVGVKLTKLGMVLLLGGCFKLG